MVDMAVGLVVGVAFGKVVTSLVNDLIMPPIGLLLGKVDFKSLFVNLSSTPYETLAEAEKAGAPVLRVGMFVNTLLDFVIVAFAIFLVIRQVNKLKKEPAEAKK
jgi:large conductance mechanosensitive channel